MDHMSTNAPAIRPNRYDATCAKCGDTVPAGAGHTYKRPPFSRGPVCMHRLCVNPAHLEAVTTVTNSRRRSARMMAKRAASVLP